MTAATLNPRGDVPHDSHWLRRVLLVTFCVGLAALLVVAFTRVVAARVPEQRATLEKLIAQHTGLEVRFDNVHFAWGFDGTSAVFTQVELSEPKQRRLHVRAPELRVELDAWDYLRHHEFSFGHVTLVSPEIEITPRPLAGDAPRAGKPGAAVPVVARDIERELLRRVGSWAELMPAGRIEVLGARVHIIEPGERKRTSVTLSQAQVRRNGTSFSAFGTMLLAQDVGQSLFVSVNLKQVGGDPAAMSGDARVIARRVFLDKLALAGAKGRGTLDARLKFAKGHVTQANWQASARELELGGGRRFDHATVEGKLEREGDTLAVSLSDLQITRGAQLQRAPAILARLTLDTQRPGIARTRVTAASIPFLGVEFIAGALAPQLRAATPFPDGEWQALAGELRNLDFDSGARRANPDGWRLSAEVRDLALERADRAELRGLDARLEFDARALNLRFDPASAATLELAATRTTRPVSLAGTLTLPSDATSAVRFDGVEVKSGSGTLALTGEWSRGAAPAPLELTVHNLDRAWLLDVWQVALDEPPPATLSHDIEAGSIESGALRLAFARGGDTLDWQRSSADLTLVNLTSMGVGLPKLVAAKGRFALKRGAATLHLEGGEIESLALASAELTWPRRGEPRLRASLSGELSAPLVRRALAPQGLDRLAGAVSIQAEARGEREMRTPDSWRITAAITRGSLKLTADVPAVTGLSGNLRYASGQLRALTLAGEWLGGPVKLESRRAAARGALNVALEGTATSAAFAKLLGDSPLAARLDGEVQWTGSAVRLAGADDWRVSLASNLAGLESSLPEPFAKSRQRTRAVAAELRVDELGIREFELTSGRDFLVRGSVAPDSDETHFDIDGIAGELRHTARAPESPEVRVAKLDLKRGPAVLAAAGALLPQDARADFTIDDLRYANRSLGALRASVTRGRDDLRFEVESPATSPHRLQASGHCAATTGCSAEFTAATTQLASLMRDAQVPAEWPAESLHAAGVVAWSGAQDQDDLTGRFELAAAGRVAEHQLVGKGVIGNGVIRLEDLQGTGPEPTQVFRGKGRVDYAEREYNLSIDYENVALAATAVPRPAAAKLARLWTTLRGSAAKRGWTEAPAARRVEWRGNWEEP
jgi:hypothetical protein